MMLQTLILVVGCHRSGTSAVAGTLARLGAKLPPNLLESDVDNPRGFNEGLLVVIFHERLFEMLGASWDHPPVEGVEPDIAVDELVEMIWELPGPTCVVKDPRASLFVKMWQTACERLGVRLCVVEVERDAASVADSLQEREGWDSDTARSLVRSYTDSIVAARDTRGETSWATLHFPQDMTSVPAWHRLIRDLDLRFRVSEAVLCEGFDPSLVHHGELACA